MQTFFFIKSGHKFARINFGDIIYVEGLKNYVRIVTAQKKHTALTTLKQVERHFPPHLFCRVHRSYIVALNAITGFTHAEVYLGNISLPVGAVYKKILHGKVLIITQEPLGAESLGAAFVANSPVRASCL